MPPTTNNGIRSYISVACHSKLPFAKNIALQKKLELITALLDFEISKRYYCEINWRIFRCLNRCEETQRLSSG